MARCLVAGVASAAFLLLSVGRGLAAEPSLSPELGYQCPDGSQVHVMYCRDASPEADCAIIRPDLPMRAGIQAQSVARRGDLLRSLAACRPHAIIQDRGTVRLGAAVSIAAARPQATAAAARGTAAGPARAAVAARPQWGEVVYWDNGQIRRIGTMAVEYCCGDQVIRVGGVEVATCCGGVVTRIGNLPVETWPDGRWKRVGDMEVEYWLNGQMRYIGRR